MQPFITFNRREALKEDFVTTQLRAGHRRVDGTIPWVSGYLGKNQWCWYSFKGLRTIRYFDIIKDAKNA